MNKFLEKLKDILYDSLDYVIMIVIVAVVIGVIGWRLDVLFAKDALDVSPGTVITDNSNNSLEKPDDIIPDQAPQENEEPVDNETLIEVETPVQEPQTPPTEPVPAPSGEKINITIPSGSLPGKIASILAENGVIDSSKNFIAKAVELKLDTKLKSGTYSISKGSTYEDILAVLTK